jgi:pimeloyl-ACP methyl ester carboxylesterase
LKKVAQAHFPTLDEDEWMSFARNTFRDEKGVPKSDYDSALRHTLPKIIASDDANIPKLWAQFNALKNFPTLAIRGENSDLLTKETLQKMHDAHEKMLSLTLKNRGHTPFLTEIQAVAAIDRFVNQIDRN